MQDRSEGQGFVVCERECIGYSPGNEPQTLMRCHSYGLPQLYETLGLESVCGRTYNSKGHKGENFCFSSLS